MRRRPKLPGRLGLAIGAGPQERRERVRPVEPPADERAPVLRASPRKMPRGVPADPEGLAAAVPWCPAFRMEEVPW